MCRRQGGKRGEGTDEAQALTGGDFLIDTEGREPSLGDCALSHTVFSSNE